MQGLLFTPLLQIHRILLVRPLGALANARGPPLFLPFRRPTPCPQCFCVGPSVSWPCSAGVETQGLSLRIPSALPCSSGACPAGSLDTCWPLAPLGFLPLAPAPALESRRQTGFPVCAHPSRPPTCVLPPSGLSTNSSLHCCKQETRSVQGASPSLRPGRNCRSMLCLSWLPSMGKHASCCSAHTFALRLSYLS